MKKLYLIALFSWIAFVSFGANGNSGKKLDHVFCLFRRRGDLEDDLYL